MEISIPFGEFLTQSEGSQHHTSVVSKLEGFRALNMYNADFDSISLELYSIDWDELWNSSDLEEFSKLLYQLVLKTCEKFTI